MADDRIEVVLVDDEPDVRFVVGRHLELSGHFAVVGEGSTGKDAVSLARELRPRLMLLDVWMPELDGLEALPEVRAASPDTTVVMLSALSGDRLEETARARGASAFLVKGASMSQLPPTLLEVLAAGSEGRPPPPADQLRASEERFRILVEGVRDYAIFMLDPSGHITTWNLGAERLNGWRADEIIGRHFRVLYPEEARRIRHPEHELELALRDGRYEEEGWRVRKDGSRFWSNVLITALVDDDGRPAGFAKITRDMSEQRTAAEARERAAAELTDANAQLRDAAEQTAQFVALTAHELRSPITAITGAAEILRTYWNELDDAERAESLDSILRGGQRIRRLLDDLILVSRLEARSFDFRLEDLPLLSILDEAVAEVSDQVTDVTVTCDEPFMVRADRTRLCQIVTNLVINGAHHGRPPVEVDAVRRGDEIEIRVRDSGPGVPEDMVGRLFGKFVKGPAGGSGLGLFIVRELVVGQGGRAWYERDDGGRSCFGFSLPLVDA